MYRILPIILAFCLVPSAFAATGDLTTVQEPLTAIITGPDDIAVGRTLVLDASASRGLGENTSYKWFIGDAVQPISRTLEAVFTPEGTGTVTIKLVISTTIDNTELESTVKHQITVYNRKIILIADQTVDPEKIALHEESAKEAGAYLRVIQPTDSSLPVGSEQALADTIQEQAIALAGAEQILVWTDDIIGLQALMRGLEQETDRLQDIRNQTIVVITNRSLQSVGRTARGPFSVLQPKKILITRKEAINPVFSIENADELEAELEKRDIDLLVVNAENAGLRPWNLISSLVNFMLTRGVSSQIVILLLTLPVIATILTFIKQVIGITTFGLYTPSIIALSFLAMGWGIGLTFLIAILITSYGARALMKRWRLLYIPKVAIILTLVSFTLLILIAFGTLFDVTFGKDTIFILIIMSTLAESFLTVKTEQGWFHAIIGISETIAAALLCVFIVQSTLLQSIVIAYPELILFTIVINALLGRWTGLRLVEYFRFREVFKHLQEE